MPDQFEQSDDKKSRFKRIIRQLESSNGQNMNHEPIQTGINAGETAGGAYGILPNSLKNFIHQGRNRDYILPANLTGVGRLTDDEITDKLNNDRNFDENAADLGASILLQKTGQDESKAAAGWRRGTNQDFQNITPEDIQQDPYVRAYNNLKDADNNNYITVEPSDNESDEDDDQKNFEQIKKYFNED